MAVRARIFETPALDVGDFKPKTETEHRPNADEIDQVSGAKFRSREAAPAPPVVDQSPAVGLPSTKRQPMVYRTGRNVTFSAKTTQVTVDAFYELARQQGWKAGETFERAVEALRLQVELAAKRP